MEINRRTNGRLAIWQLIRTALHVVSRGNNWSRPQAYVLGPGARDRNSGFQRPGPDQILLFFLFSHLKFHTNTIKRWVCCWCCCCWPMLGNNAGKYSLFPVSTIEVSTVPRSFDYPTAGTEPKSMQRSRYQCQTGGRNTSVAETRPGFGGRISISN